MSLEHVAVAARAASTKTDEEIVVLDVGDLLGITDHFVIASGRSDRQVKAIVDEVRRRLRDEGCGAPRQVEGLDAAEWVLIDYGEFVVHVFVSEARDFYGLERLWSDAPAVTVDSVGAASPA